MEYDKSFLERTNDHCVVLGSGDDVAREYLLNSSYINMHN